MTTLLIDNYDSYTYNVAQLLAAVSGEEPIVIPNDYVSWRALSNWEYDAIVLSPGPGRPERWHDFGVCSDILHSCDCPVLGICLGHQGLGQILDGVVETAPAIMHGRLSTIRHDASGLFEGIPQEFSVVRYHSLAVTGDLGENGRVNAWTADGVVMGIEHRSRPMWGLQFHPESIATEHGRRLFENFYALARRHRSQARVGKRPPPPPGPRRADVQRPPVSGEYQLRMRTIAGEPADSEALFQALFGDCEEAFWLDSADAPSPLAHRSLMGASVGPHRCILEYDVNQKEVTVRGVGREHVTPGSIFEALEREIATRSLVLPAPLQGGPSGGFIGYIGYECKADCGSPNQHRSDMPDALQMLATHVVAIDHDTSQTHVVALCRGADLEAERWLENAERVVRERHQLGEPARSTAAISGDHEEAVTFRCGRGREQYLSDIARCHVALTAGESYEVCLTDQIHTDASPDPWHLYRLLRRRNPAPLAAFLKFGDIAVLSSSPERFISVDSDRQVQARPIKGTAPRAEDREQDERLCAGLLDDEKTFAEHLMIVDLLRNDLGRVCETDTVRVPRFMVVESYATVHQLISTVTGVLVRDRSSVECVRACFPGGSMTGAPKLRTMSIIDDVEREARGVYSGGLGYFGLDSSVDLSIVIRTIVMRPGSTTIGAGGAIVMQSDPEEEFAEILLKARAPMAAVAEAATGSTGPDAWSVELEPSLTRAHAA
jgi:para-aminobenzoate synthetase